MPRKPLALFGGLIFSISCIGNVGLPSEMMIVTTDDQRADRGASDHGASDRSAPDGCVARGHDTACRLDCECQSPWSCRKDPTKLQAAGGGCCSQDEYWIEQLGRCQKLSSDGFCFNLEPYTENCASSPGDCCVCGGGGTEPAFFHGDVWPFWFNSRTVCDNEYKAYWRCMLQGGACTSADQEKRSCDRCEVIDGKCNESYVPGGSPCHHSCDQGGSCDTLDPGKKCGYGYYSSCHADCAVSTFDYDALWGHFYGSRWTYMNDWYIRFYNAAGGDITSSIGIGAKGEAGMNGQAATDALGAFGCYQVPAGSPLKVRIALSGWTDGPSDNTDVNIYQTFTPAPGKHYVWDLHGLHEAQSACDIPEAIKNALRQPSLSCPSSKREKTPIARPEDIPCWPPEKGTCPPP